jgi:hypothetical protein
MTSGMTSGMWFVHVHFDLIPLDRCLFPFPVSFFPFKSVYSRSPDVYSGSSGFFPFEKPEMGCFRCAAVWKREWHQQKTTQVASHLTPIRFVSCSTGINSRSPYLPYLKRTSIPTRELTNLFSFMKFIFFHLSSYIPP